MDWYSFCKQLTDLIWNATKPFIGTNEAAQKIKRGNKNSKKIDIVINILFSPLTTVIDN